MEQLFTENTANRVFFAELMLVDESSVPTFLTGGGVAETTAA